MRLQSLTHLIRAIQALVLTEKIVIFGSSSLLAIHHNLGENCQPLEQSLDADFIITPLDAKSVQILSETLGQGSVFLEKYGYYADIVKPEIADTFPGKWEERLVAFSGFEGVFALHPLDLALVKLLIARPKDLTLLETIIRHNLLSLDAIRTHYLSAILGEREATKIGLQLNSLEQRLKI